jgi:Mg-chelatase subunit ChlD
VGAFGARMAARILLALAFLFAFSTAPGCMKRKGDASSPGSYAGASPESMAAAEPGPSADAPTTWKRSTIADHTIRIEVGDEQTLPVHAMQIQAKVDGFRARVLIDVDFHNPHDSMLEGTMKLRLPEGASPYFLAYGAHVATAAPVVIARDPDAPVTATELEPEQVLAARATTWEAPKVARMVERDKAAQAYRATVQRNVDPAIAEWGGAGVFNTRLYPIAAHQMHRVVIGYDVDLVQVGDTWHLPLHLPEGAERRTLDVDVATPGTSKATLASAKGRETDGRTRFSLENPSDEAFDLAIDDAIAPAVRGTEGSTEFLAARVRPQLPEIAATGRRKAVFAVDVSMSANPDQFNVWLDLLRTTLEKNRDDIDEFAVLFFDVEAFWWETKFVSNTQANVERLMKHADTLALEGATDLAAALDEASHPSWLRGDRNEWDVFLLSDGAATWGEASVDRMALRLQEDLGGRIFAYRTGLPGSDTAALDKLARATGGAVFSVTGASEVAAAATAHKREAWELVSVLVPGVEDVVVAGAPRFLFPGQSITIAGRLRSAAPRTIRLHVRRGATTKSVDIAMPTVVESELAPRVYGQIATAQLEEFEDAGGVNALPYARHFRITGRTASLLMLDSEADYERFGLTPEIEREDAEAVTTVLASRTLERARADLARVLGDPKRELLARVRRLARVNGDDNALRKHLETLIDRMPKSAFEVTVPPLHCESHDADAVSTKVVDQLRTHELGYDDIVAEAERRRSKLSAADGLKALSSLVEANPGDTVMARDVAFIASDWGLGAQTYHLLQRVAATRPEEPQTYHALALGLAELGANDLAMLHFEIAYSGQWDGRFGAFHDIVAMDYARFLRATPVKQLANRGLAQERIAQLRQESGIDTSDLVVMITWNTDNTDVDLHVIEPNGAECFYKNPETISGGRLTRDVTQGYGPEMYTIERARRGKYKIFAHYFASNSNRLSTRTKVYATIYENFGTPQEKVTRKTVPLRDGKDVHDLAVVKF